MWITVVKVLFDRGFALAPPAMSVASSRENSDFGEDLADAQLARARRAMSLRRLIGL
jgi:hypothetical protein